MIELLHNVKKEKKKERILGNHKSLENIAVFTLFGDCLFGTPSIVYLILNNSCC